MGKHLVVPACVWLLAVSVILATLLTSAARANEIEQILRGFEIAPVKLNLKGKDWALVGLGSYLVNTTAAMTVIPIRTGQTNTIPISDKRSRSIPRNTYRVDAFF